MSSRQPFHSLLTSQQAGILCNDARIQRFAAEACDCQGRQFNESAAAQFVRTYCKIESRRQLDGDSAAKLKFQILRTEFDAWTGKIASQPCRFWHADTLNCGRPGGCRYNQKTGSCT
tara:strand:- start:3792 stop:4142 length:351 start_codon:yes stop_codon:yes gene_type:complete